VNRVCDSRDSMRALKRFAVDAFASARYPDFVTLTMPRPSCVAAHDAFNVPVLFTIASMCAIGIAMPRALDLALVTRVFALYVAADALWIFLFPRSVPRAANVVVIHHLVTLALLSNAMRHPERAIETCRNGLVEWNTLFLILRRAPGASRAWNVAYKLTLPIRFVWQPYLVIHFWRISRDDDAWERVVAIAAQVFLVAFNVFLVFGKKRRTNDGKEKNKAE